MTPKPTDPALRVTRADSTAVTIRLPNAMWEQLAAAAAAEDRSRPAIIRRAIQAYLREAGHDA